MSQVIQHNPVDVVICGMGVMGGEIAVASTLAGLSTVGIEKGPYWSYSTDFAISKYDEWGLQNLKKFDIPIWQTSMTLRNNTNQMALPWRRHVQGGGCVPGFGVGGAAHHYGGNFGRYDPWTYAIHSNTISRYGQAFLTAANPNDDTQDYPFTYNNYLPYYQTFEQGWGVTGTNQEPECPSSTYPLPPHPITPLGNAFTAAAEAVGVNSWPNPTALASKPYTNQYGVQVNACVYDGYCSCSSYQCETGAKANSAFRTVPAAIKAGLDLRTNSYVYRIDVNPSTGLATDVRYYDAMGNIHVQPTSGVIAVTLWGWYNPWLCQVSGIGNQYNPTTITGTMGRGMAQPTGAPTRTATGTINIGRTNTVWAGNGSGGGTSTYDFANDNFDHSQVTTPYIGGTRNTYGGYANSPGLLGIGSAASAANIGSVYKASKLNVTQQTTQAVSAAGAGMDLPQTTHYTDLDPHYTDVYGDPLPRCTLDYTPNSANASNDSVRLWTPVVQKMGVSITTGAAVTPGTTHLVTTAIHERGGIRIGTSPSISVLNKWQQFWVGTGPNNLFVAGEVTLPNGSNEQTGGTHPASVTARAAAEGIQMYLQNPGPLVA